MVNSLDPNSVSNEEFDKLGIDLDQVRKEEDAVFDSMGIDIEEDYEKSKEESSWAEKIGDLFVQTGRGVLKRFTWPADIIKLGMIGEGLADLDDLEEAYRNAGETFDKQKYMQTLFNEAQFVPTQDFAEKLIESKTGFSLQPKSDAGKAVNQVATIAALTRGGFAEKATTAGLGAGTTQILKDSGVGEGKAELIGDIIGFSPSALEKLPRKLSNEAVSFEQTARKHGLPFLEYMTKERKPWLDAKLFKKTEERIKDQFNVSTTDALKKIVENEIPIKRLRERGINLDALGEHAYQTTELLAKAKPTPIKTNDIVKNIEKEISRIKSLAPSPSDAQKTAIKLLEEEKNIFKISNPTSEQLINQHKNYNADMKSIYRKPEFSGKEEQIRKTYEFLKDQLVTTMEKQGSADVASSFKAANKIYHEKSKLNQTESLINKAFTGNEYSPKKLDKLLNSKQGNFLRRNMSPIGIKDLEEIVQYGKKAQEKISQFMELKSPSVTNEIKSWGKLAPLIFLPHNLKGAALAYMPTLVKKVWGNLLTRPVTREAYKLTLKNAANGSFDLLKKDFFKLENLINQEYGSVDNFLDSIMEELEIYEGD